LNTQNNNNYFFVSKPSKIMKNLMGLDNHSNIFKFSNNNIGVSQFLK